jgi:hypothetical protein
MRVSATTRHWRVGVCKRLTAEAQFWTRTDPFMRHERRMRSLFKTGRQYLQKTHQLDWSSSDLVLPVQLVCGN